MTGRVRIASWNIRKAVGLDWRRDPARVLRVLERLGADIVLLQEADKRLQPRHPALPLAMVRQAGWTPVDADPATPSIGHHGNAILLGKDFALSRLKPLDLPGFEPRGAVLAEIAHGHGSFTVGALHLGLRRRDRVRQMAYVLGAAERFGGPAILGGDLNEWRGRLPLLPRERPWHEIAPGPSFHAAHPRFALDRFAVSTDVSVQGHGVVPQHLAARASDHLPVWIDVTLP